jgi:hypothetical protein
MMFDSLINLYLSEFQKQGEPYLKVIANCAVPSKIVLMKYKELPPIESLEEVQKKELWEYANETFPDETNSFKIRFCEIKYTIGVLL